MVFNRSEPRSQKNRQPSSCTCTRISNTTRLIGLLLSSGNQYNVGSLLSAHQQTIQTKLPYGIDAFSSSLLCSYVFAVLSSCFRVSIQYLFKTTTRLLAALSVGAKTNLLWNSWIPFFKCLKVNLGLGGRRSKLLQ